MPVAATLGRQPLAPPDTGAADVGRNRSGGEGADDRGIRLTRNITFALLLAVSFMGGGAHAASARNEAPPPGPTTSPHERGGRGNGVTRDLPSAIAESGDHGLPQRAVEIARPFGFPITNSMIVSWIVAVRSEEHTSELQSLTNLVCRLLLEKKKNNSATLYSS